MTDRDYDVAVIGSYGVGLWITAPRMPAGGETVLGRGFEFGNGGKGSNQAIGVARLRGRCAILACVGDDRFGAEAMELWAREGVDASNVRVSTTAPTMAGFIILDETGENRIITDPGANSELTSQDVDAFVPILRRSRVMITQMEIPVFTLAAGLSAARAAGCRTIVNPAPASEIPRDVLALADVITPNQTEARILLGLPPDDPRPDADIAQLLIEAGVGAVAMTRGADGALLLTADQLRHVPAPSVKVVDTTGAGDGFNGAFALALARGQDLETAVHAGVVAGSCVVRRQGVVPALPTQTDIDGLLATCGLAR